MTSEWSAHPNSHQEKCKKYKRQIEDLKLDNIELQETVEKLQAQLIKLKTGLQNGKTR